jgi:hypothetical protein
MIGVKVVFFCELSGFLFALPGKINSPGAIDCTLIVTPRSYLMELSAGREAQ